MGFMLAVAVETPDELFDKRDGLELPPLLVEEKYDGIRAQVHKNKRGEVRIFSRTLAEVTEFPELVEPISELPGELIIDGEILAWRDTRPLPLRNCRGGWDVNAWICSYRTIFR